MLVHYITYIVFRERKRGIALTKTNKGIGYIVGIILGLIAIVIVVLYGIHLQNKSADEATVASPEPTELVLNSDAQGITTVVDTIAFETVQEGLNDMGFLVTEEYFFTEVVTREKTKELLKTGITLPFTESSYVASYDGVVTAGVDFSKITVTVDPVDNHSKITITVPKPEIQTVSIDPDSFVLYSEKNGLGTRFSAEEYNESLKGLEDEVRNNAIDKDILGAAGEHAVQQIETFVKSLCAGQDYLLNIVLK